MEEEEGYGGGASSTWGSWPRSRWYLPPQGVLPVREIVNTLTYYVVWPFGYLSQRNERCHQIQQYRSNEVIAKMKRCGCGRTRGLDTAWRKTRFRRGEKDCCKDPSRPSHRRSWIFVRTPVSHKPWRDGWWGHWGVQRRRVILLTTFAVVSLFLCLLTISSS